MFAGKVSMHLKGSVPEFTQTLEREVLPCFENRRDSGTKSRLSHRGAYAEVTKARAKVIDGTPQVETYEVATSTFHKIAAAAVA
jgi:hypothetical protein